MNYIIYCRKSSESEDRQILSIDSQEQELLQIAKSDGLNVVKIFKESMSAKTPGRPGFEKMMTLIEKNKNYGVIVWKLDRLARNPVDGGRISWLLQCGTIKAIQTHERTYLPTD